MLFTRCPNCETTFRITEAALQKADGQVRCGRCAHIFDANQQLRGRDEENGSLEAAEMAGSEHAVRTARTATTEATAPEADADSGTDRGAEVGAAGTIENQDAEDAAGAVETAAEADADVAGITPPGANPDIEAGLDADPDTDSEADAEVDAPGDAAPAGNDRELPASEAAATADDASAEKAHDDLTADEIEAVLADLATATRTEPAWMRDGDGPTAASRPGVWRAAAILATVALGLQLTNHFRAELAGAPVVGSMLQAIYGLAGIKLQPRWDATQYELVDWKALAEPGASGQGNLVIESRVRNKGPDAQPYPFIHLRLLDRWEETVGSRVFAPAEYLTSPPAETDLMAAGTTTDAELIIVDPGPDAYGFELDVCVDLGEAYDCAADDVFN